MSGGFESRPATRGALGAVQPVLGRGDLTCDAWGRQKFIADYSVLHGMFTFEVPEEMWYEKIAGVEQSTFVNATSVNGKLHLTSAGVLDQSVMLRTFEHPRYEPNRGYLYSSSLFLPAPEAAGVRRWGVFTEEAGWFYELVGDGNNFELYQVQRTTVNTVTSDDRELVQYFPADWNSMFGNTYDLQGQWRGVGDLFAYIGDDASGTSRLVHWRHNLNKSTELSIFNPALPIAFECINKGDDVVIEAGCVDVSVEGGKNADGVYGAIATEGQTGRIAIPGPAQYNTPVLAVHLKDTHDGLLNTRDVQNLAFTAYSDVDAVVRVWITRDPAAITLGTQVWKDFRDGHIEYVQYDPSAGTPVAFNTALAQLQFGTGIAGGIPVYSPAVFEHFVKLVATAGDYLIFTMHRDNGGAANVGLTYEFSEAI